MIRRLALIVCAFVVLHGGTALAASGAALNIIDFGAVGNGITLNTAAFQRAIDSCAVTGGTIVVPPGRFLTGALELRSNITIDVQAGATILGSTRLADYVPHTPSIRSYNDYFLLYSLFYAEGKENITLCGKGTIDGQGKYFKVAGKEKPARYKDRPFVFRFVKCSNVRVEGLSLQNSAMWMQHYFACENVTIAGIRVYNHANKNNDMMDIDGCRNVTVSDCIGDTDDDAITLKSTSELVTESIVITNCIVSSHCNAIKTGTESTGGFRNIAISNCVVRPSRADAVITGKKDGIGGIVLTLVDGGVMEGISVNNIVIDGTEAPIFVRLGNRGRLHYDGAPVPPVGRMKGISISNVRASNTNTIGCSVTGIPNHDIEDITLDNIAIVSKGGAVTQPAIVPAEMEDSYPEATQWGMLPSYGFFVRHAKNIQFRNCTLTNAAEDVRPAFVLDDVHGCAIERLTTTLSSAAEAAVVVSSSDHVRIANSSVRGGTRSLVALTGASNAGIIILNNDAAGITNAVSPVQPKNAAVTVSGNVLR